MNISKLLKNLANFYLTLSIPLLYILILVTIAATPSVFPTYLWPIILVIGRSEGRYISMIIAGVGLLLWISAYFYLKQEFSVLPHQPQKVVKSGPYKYLRHPMYVGIFLTFTGLSLANLSAPGFLLNLLILTPINWYRAVKETEIYQHN